MQEWVVHRLGDYAQATRDQRISKAKAFFGWCQSNGYLDNNPATVLKRPKNTWQPDPFTHEEVELVLAAARQGSQGIRNYALCCFLLDSGMRNSELRNLVPEDIDVKSGQVKIREGAKGSKTRTVIIGMRKWMIV
jgi:site-specific recombinase XerD